MLSPMTKHKVEYELVMKMKSLNKLGGGGKDIARIFIIWPKKSPIKVWGIG